MADETPTEPVPVPSHLDLAVAEATHPLAAADQAVLDNAVAYLNQAMCESGVRLAVVVSDYVVATFFGGDPAKLSVRSSHKGASYYALCQRDDLEMGRATLQRLVRIGLQVKQLPPELGSALTPGQHRALLVVEEPAQKVELAKKALAEHWTAEQLEDVVAKAKPVPMKKRGRAAKPEIVKQVLASAAGPLAWAAGTDFANAYAALDEDNRAEVLKALNAMADAVKSVLGAMPT